MTLLVTALLLVMLVVPLGWIMILVLSAMLTMVLMMIVILTVLMLLLVMAKIKRHVHCLRRAFPCCFPSWSHLALLLHATTAATAAAAAASMEMTTTTTSQCSSCGVDGDYDASDDDPDVALAAQGLESLHLVFRKALRWMYSAYWEYWLLL